MQSVLKISASISTQNINSALSYNGAELNISKLYPTPDFEYGGMYIEDGYNIVINSTISMYNGLGIMIKACNKTQSYKYHCV